MIDRLLLLPTSGEKLPVQPLDSSTPAAEGFSAELEDLLAALAAAATANTPAPEIPSSPQAEQPNTAEKQLPAAEWTSLIPKLDVDVEVVPAIAAETKSLQSSPAPELEELKKAVQPDPLKDRQSIRPELFIPADTLLAKPKVPVVAIAQPAPADLLPSNKIADATPAATPRPEIIEQVDTRNIAQVDTRNIAQVNTRNIAQVDTRKPALQSVDTTKARVITTDVIASLQQSFFSPVMIGLQPLQKPVLIPSDSVSAPVVLPRTLRPLAELTSLPVPPLNGDALYADMPELPSPQVIDRRGPLPVDLPDVPDDLPSTMLGTVKKFFQMVNEHSAVKPIDVRPVEQVEAMITTDPIASLRQSQLPAGVIAISKILGDTKLQMRPKLQAAVSDSANPGTPLPMQDSATLSRSPITVEGSIVAHPIEIPDPPKLPLVRTVAMEVGEADSHVTIRIEERAGDMKVHLGVANEMLHRELSSSMGSLIHTLKQEDIQVSAAEVSKKSPIEKVRRMKEARNGHS